MVEAAPQEIDELIRVVTELKDQGNVKFKDRSYKLAIALYLAAFQKSQENKNSTPALDKLKVTILQNMSVCTNHTEEYQLTVRNCTAAIEIDANATKAFYHRAVANQKLEDFDKALVDIKAAIKLAPGDANMRTVHESIKKEKAAKEKKQTGFQKTYYGQPKEPISETSSKLLRDNELEIEKHTAMIANQANQLPQFHPDHMQTYFDIQVGEEGQEKYAVGRVVFEIFQLHVPKVAENFRVLCTGEQGQEYHLKNTCFHRIIEGFMMQGGDTTAGNGTGGLSIYGEKFKDDGGWLPHTHNGVLSMANSGPNTNGSQFFINFSATPHLDGKHELFGRVIHNYGILEKAERTNKGPGDRPCQNVKIVNCGELLGADKLTPRTADFLSNYGYK